MNSEDDIETADRRLCSECVRDEFLRTEIEREGTRSTCYYCAQSGITITIEEMADRVETAFERHYYHTDTETSSTDYTAMREGYWERDGEPVADLIGSASGVDEAPAEDVRQVLEYRHEDFDRDQMGEEGPFDEEAHYAEKALESTEFLENWSYFKKSLLTEARFFNAKSEAILQSVFDGLTDHKARNGKTIIVAAGPGTEMPVLYRARVFQSVPLLLEALKHPDKKIGTPPSGSALAGRMNARGISVFYGATDTSVAVGEVRPPVGSRVAVGRFELLREVRLLDIEALKSVYVEGSIFDPEYIRHLERAKFLGMLSGRITMPVMPEDEPLGHLVTQTIADYLASRGDPALDGILYPSVQGIEGGVNVVLFHKAAGVASIDLPEGTEIIVHSGHNTEEGWEEDYSVREEVPPKGSDTTLEKQGHIHDLGALIAEPLSYDNDLREPTLRLDLKSLTVHRVTAARFETDAFRVPRHRSEKQKTKC